MALRNIVTDEDPILRKVCRPVGEVTPRIQMILDDMVETMRDANGVGLAAPQVGIMRRMFVAEPEPERVYYFVDPEMVTLEGEQESDEGCLSVPGMVGTVKRPEKIVIKDTTATIPSTIIFCPMLCSILFAASSGFSLPLVVANGRWFFLKLLD